MRAGNSCSLDGLMPGDCDDADATARPGGVEICDGADDDCDGTTDEGGDGWCSSRASVASGTCAGGSCSLTCNTGRGNCNAAVSDGCEVNTQANASHCGTCGNACRTICDRGGCEDLVQIATGGGHSCALRRSGVGTRELDPQTVLDL